MRHLSKRQEAWLNQCIVKYAEENGKYPLDCEDLEHDDIMNIFEMNEFETFHQCANSFIWDAFPLGVNAKIIGRL